MPDIETKVPELLDALAAEVLPAEPDGWAPTLRRARRRRAVNASLGGLLAAAILAGSVLGLRAAGAGGGSVPGRTGPSPTAPQPAPVPAFEGVWPEMSPADLASGQDQVDRGHQPWRLDPEQVAAAFAVNLMGWAPEQVQTMLLGRSGPEATVSLRDGETVDSPRTVVRLSQLGRTGPTGVWSVAAADGEPIKLGVPRFDPAARQIVVAGEVNGAPAGAAAEILFLDGPTIEDVAGSTTVPADGTFAASVPVESTSTHLTLLVRLVDDGGRVLATSARATSVSLASPTPAVPSADLPAAVAATHEGILEAARLGDLEGLAGFVDQEVFSFDFGVANPVDRWRRDPSLLDTMVKILEMPWAVNDEGGRTIYGWPYFTQADLASLGASDLELLATIGITEAEVRSMAELGSGYLGPRIGIAADGTWLFFVTGGD